MAGEAELSPRERGRPARRRLTAAAIAGSLLALGLVIFDTVVAEDNARLLVAAGEQGPAAAVIRHDLPGDLPPGQGHDGQQNYAIARAPMHMDEVSGHLDRPQYRLGRPLLPWLAWVLSPTGGGWRLVGAMVFAGTAAIALLALATGLLAGCTGRAPAIAVIASVLPGAYYSLRLGAADALAVGLALLGIALSLGGRHRMAILPAGAAALAKESSVLLLAGYAIWRRDRHGLLLTAIPAFAFAVWMSFVRLSVTEAGQALAEIRPPFAGWWDSVHVWSDGQHLAGAFILGSALLAGGATLWRVGLRSPLGWPIALQLIFLTVLSREVLALPANSARAALPIHALALAAVAARVGDRQRRRTPAPQGMEPDPSHAQR